MNDEMKCRWCGKDTKSLGTGECDSCWELRTRIEGNLELALRMAEVITWQKKVEV